MTKKQRQQVYDKYGGRCAYCGCELQKGWHVDHLEPIGRNWAYEKDEQGRRTDKIIQVQCDNPERDCIENMMPACASCNITKHSLSVERFREVVTQFVESLNNYHSIYRIAKRYGLIQETGHEVVFYFELFQKNQ